LIGWGYHVKPHPFSLRQLQYAVAVADTRGFRRAASSCHVSQPSLSAQLAQLETVLGARLFERNRQQILLTAAGETLVGRARRLLAEADGLVAAAQQFRDPLAGTLRIGVIPTVSPYRLPALVPVLRARYPRLTLVWSEDRTAGVLRDLGAGRLDAALVARVSGMEDFEQAVIGEDPFVLAGRPGHPLLRRRGPATLDELRGQRVLLLEDGHCFREQALALCAAAGAREAEVTATSLATLAQMVARGPAITLLPALSLAVERRRTTLAIRRFAPPAPSRTLVLAWRRQSPGQAALRALAEAMRAPDSRPHRREPAAPGAAPRVRGGHRTNGGRG
jgi:LysR family hydrogen peroxide-inducible transcriptional activator